MTTPAKIGDWWTVCCEVDLHELTAPEEVEEAQEYIDSDEAETHWSRTLWPTREAALAALTPQINEEEPNA